VGWLADGFVAVSSGVSATVKLLEHGWRFMVYYSIV
jgi:hypothetical protein